MAKPSQQRRGGNKTLRTTESLTTDGAYEAPTVGYKDVLYEHGDTKAAATFTRVGAVCGPTILEGG